MKKSQAHLLKLASKFSKYAETQSLQDIIENAAGYGEQSANGIMNFPAQLKTDKADLSIDVTVSNGMLGGYNIEVAPPSVDPAQFAPRYAKLPEQIKKYLDRHIKSFPQVYPGTTSLRFTGKDSGSGIAQN